MPQLETSSWTSFKQVVITNKDLSLQYTENPQSYDVYGPDLDGLVWHFRLIKNGGTDVTDFENNYKASSNQSIRLSSQIIFPRETYTTTATLASIRPVNGNFDSRMLSHTSVGLKNIGASAANVQILGSIDGTNYDITIVALQSLAAGAGLHGDITTSFQSVTMQAQIPASGSATTLASAGYGVK